jgi:hypothetical protein
LAIRFVGGAVENTIYFNIYSNKLKILLPEYLVEYATKAGLPQTSAKHLATVYAKGLAAGALKPAMFDGITGVDAQVLQSAELGYRWAYVHGVRLVFRLRLGWWLVFVVYCCPTLRDF